MKKKTQYISQLIRSYINLIDPNAEAILYGSRARGDERTESDWDILILTDYPIDLDKERLFRNKLYDLELETEEPFSIFIYAKTDWYSTQSITPFYYNVSHEGIKI